MQAMTFVTARPTRFGVRKSSSHVNPAHRYPRVQTEDYVAKFDRLHKIWNTETLLSSSVSEMRRAESYKSILEMGSHAIPLIIHELSVRPSLIFIALSELTGEDPVPASDKGNVKNASMAWIEWFQRQ